MSIGKLLYTHISLVCLTHSLRNTPQAILHFWGVSSTLRQDSPLNSLINTIRFPRSPFSAEPSLHFIALCSTMAFWAGNLLRHHSCLLFGPWPGALAKLPSRVGISTTVHTIVCVHRHTHGHSWPGRTGSSPTASVISFCTLEWLRGWALLPCVHVIVFVSVCEGPEAYRLYTKGGLWKKHQASRKHHRCCSPDLC